MNNTRKDELRKAVNILTEELRKKKDMTGLKYDKIYFIRNLQDLSCYLKILKKV